MMMMTMTTTTMTMMMMPMMMMPMMMTMKENCLTLVVAMTMKPPEVGRGSAGFQFIFFSPPKK